MGARWPGKGHGKGPLGGGLCPERQLLLRLVRKRFGAEAMERSRPLLDVVEELAALEVLGEGVLDCADGEAWLAMLARRVN